MLWYEFNSTQPGCYNYFADSAIGTYTGEVFFQGEILCCKLCGIVHIAYRLDSCGDGATGMLNLPPLRVFY